MTEATVRTRSNIVAMSALLPSLALAVLLEARHYAPAEGCDTVLNAFCEAECSGPPGVKYARRAGLVWRAICVQLRCSLAR